MINLPVRGWQIINHTNVQVIFKHRLSWLTVFARMRQSSCWYQWGNDMRPFNVHSLKTGQTRFEMWAVVCALIVLLPSTVMASDLRPNIVVVLADDLGYGDLACYGHPVIKTPHLDQFAREGLRFTDCYAAAANCSPARTGLMTGRTPTRVGIHNWIPMFSPMHVRRSEITIATLLRNAGYSTCHVGKWHLNGDFNLPSQPQPSDHGFDHWFSTQNNALPNNRNPFNFVRNGKPVGPLKGFAARLVADKAITWLEKGRDQEKSFFLYVCFHEPHEPIASDKRFGDL